LQDASDAALALSHMKQHSELLANQLVTMRTSTLLAAVAAMLPMAAMAQLRTNFSIRPDRRRFSGGTMGPLNYPPRRSRNRPRRRILVMSVMLPTMFAGDGAADPRTRRCESGGAAHKLRRCHFENQT
jgi:hypothetical protein